MTDATKTVLVLSMTGAFLIVVTLRIGVLASLKRTSPAQSRGRIVTSWKNAPTFVPLWNQVLLGHLPLRAVLHLRSLALTSAVGGRHCTWMIDVRLCLPRLA